MSKSNSNISEFVALNKKLQGLEQFQRISLISLLLTRHHLLVLPLAREHFRFPFSIQQDAFITMNELCFMLEHRKKTEVFSFFTVLCVSNLQSLVQEELDEYLMGLSLDDAEDIKVDTVRSVSTEAQETVPMMQEAPSTSTSIPPFETKSSRKTKEELNNLIQKLPIHGIEGYSIDDWEKVEFETLRAYCLMHGMEYSGRSKHIYACDLFYKLNGIPLELQQIQHELGKKSKTELRALGKCPEKGTKKYFVDYFAYKQYEHLQKKQYNAKSAAPMAPQNDEPMELVSLIDE